MKLQLSQNSGVRKVLVGSHVLLALPLTDTGGLLGACLVFICSIDEDAVLANAKLLCIWAGFS